MRGGARRAWEEEFVAYYAAKGEMLRRTAFALCGDWHLAEDLTQTAFTNLYRVWNRIERHEVLDQYARRVLLRAFLGQGRLRPARLSTRGQIGVQFLVESLLLSVLGGAAGVAAGVGVTAAYAINQGWPTVAPVPVTAGALGLALVIGVVAGSYPAARAARLSPTEALA